MTRTPRVAADCQIRSCGAITRKEVEMDSATDGVAALLRIGRSSDAWSHA
jgi:hypothetical protein